VSTNDSSVTAFEAAWDYLWFALRHEESNWLGFVSARTYNPIDQLVLRAEDFIRPLHRGVERIVVKSEADLFLAMNAVTTERPSRTALVWVDVRMSETSTGPGVLSLLVARMNEHRAAILRNPVGVVVSTTLRLFPSIATPAPDLWSVRSFAIDIDSEIPYDEPVVQTEVDLANDALSSLTGKASSIGSLKIGTSPVGVPTPWDSLAATAFDLAGHDPVRAAEAAKAALAGEARFGLSTILRLLDLIDKTVGVGRATAVSLARLRVLKQVFENSPNPENGYAVLAVMGELTNRFVSAQRLRNALDNAQSQLRFARAFVTRFGESPGSLTSLGLSLDKVGYVGNQSGIYNLYENIYGESLEVWRSLIERFGETEDRLVGLALSLEQAGDNYASRGDLVPALAMYEEALEIRRELANQIPEEFVSLHDLSGVLARMGDVRWARGDTLQADLFFDEAIEVAERSRLLDTSSDSLRHISLLYGRLGDTAKSRGELGIALEKFLTGLQLRREISLQFGETPDRLRDQMAFLERAGSVAELQDNWPVAEGLYRSASELSMLLLHLGENAETLSDASIMERRIGDSEKAQGRMFEAEQHHREALRMARMSLEKYGESPQRLRDLGYLLDRVTDHAEFRNDLHEAELLGEESLEIRRDLVTRFGKTPDNLADLPLSLFRLARLKRNKSEARLLAEEAVCVNLEVVDRFGHSPGRVQDLARSYGLLATIDLKRGDSKLAKIHIDHGLDALASVDEALRLPVDDRIRGALLEIQTQANLKRLGGVGWIESLRSRLR
jgi:tetratricopeptide (TPR) repeat protein